jgi:hypothetical protein
VSLIEVPLEYREWAEKFKAKNGRYPIGIEILRYWEKHPQIYQAMCPNPARIVRAKPEGDTKTRKRKK